MFLQIQKIDEMHYLLHILLFIFTFQTTYAEENNLFRIDNIKVYAKTGDLIDSKSLAIANGSISALKTLILNLNAASQNDPEYHNALRACIDNLKSSEKVLKDYVIRSERMTSKSYSGYIDFIFNRQAVESIMNSCGLKYASVSPGNVLLIPVLIDKNMYRILNNEMDDEFLSIINEMNDNLGVLKLKKIPYKNILDIIDIDPEFLFNATYSDFSNTLKIHSCSSVLIFGIKSRTNDSLSIEIKFLSKNDEYHDTFSYKLTKGENRKTSLKYAINDTLKNVDRMWKRGFENDNSTVFNSGVIFEMKSPDEWRKISSAINNIDSIKQYRFKTVSENKIDIELRYIGSPEELSKKLFENGIAIFKRDEKTIMKLIK